jgi:hypothetical protein
MNIETLRELIRRGVVQVNFIKKNGEDRVMMATTSSDYLPEQGEGAFTAPVNDKFLTVWDIEADGWRSINFDAVNFVEWDDEDVVRQWRPEMGYNFVK